MPAIELQNQYNSLIRNEWATLHDRLVFPPTRQSPEDAIKHLEKLFTPFREKCMALTAQYYLDSPEHVDVDECARDTLPWYAATFDFATTLTGIVLALKYIESENEGTNKAKSKRNNLPSENKENDRDMEKAQIQQILDDLKYGIRSALAFAVEDWIEDGKNREEDIYVNRMYDLFALFIRMVSEI